MTKEPIAKTGATNQNNKSRSKEKLRIESAALSARTLEKNDNTPSKMVINSQRMHMAFE